MSWQNLLALIVFVCVCGFIAYAGDVLGWRMGKRRLSIFGLRPRYTAIVITILTGMLIATLTIVVMAIASKQVRDLALHGARILKEHKAALEAYAKSTRELRIQRQKAEEARVEVLKVKKQRDKLGAEISALTIRLHHLKESLRLSKAALAEAERRKADAEHKLQLATESITRLNVEIASLRDEITKATGDLTSVQKELELNIAARAEAIKQLEAAEAELASANRDIEQSKQQIAAQKSEIARLEDERAKLAKLFVEEMGQVAAKWPRYIALREGDIIFRSKGELARAVIRCAQTKSDIRADLMRLLEEADKRAKAEGAAVGDNGRAVEILPVKIETDKPGEGHFVSESQKIDALVDNIWAGAGSVVVLVVSVGNSVRGEQVLVDLVLYQNELIYSKGEEVANTFIDGRLSYGGIFSQIISFLRNEVRFAAIHRRMIPTYDVEGPTVGRLSEVGDWDKVFNLVLRIKSAGERVRVKAVAQDDTWSQGPLVVDFVMSDVK